MWATARLDDANEVLAPLLDLPEAPPEYAADLLHWKTRALVTAAAGRPFVWVDDELTGLDRAWVARHHRGKALLHRVDPATGLTDGDFAAVGKWLRSPN